MSVYRHSFRYFTKVNKRPDLSVYQIVLGSGNNYFISTVNILNVPGMISGRKVSLEAGLNKPDGR